MENRFENLYGYVQRSLVKNIRKELGNDESMTIGILLYNAYVDSFYYEGTVKNPLLFPEEIKKQFLEKKIWNLELMYHLGRYFSKPKTKTYIAELIEENTILARNNGSYYAIAFDRYDEFKVAWLDWLRDLGDYLVVTPYHPENLIMRTLLNQLFHFGNYLLTIIRIPAYRNNFVPGRSNLSEHIFRAITGQLFDDSTGLVDRETGEVPPPLDGITWHARPDTLIKYSDLTLILEVCFKQPFAVEDKIRIIGILSESKIEKLPVFQLAVMSKPLFYNGEFQGIIYASKLFEKGNYTDEEFQTFKKAVIDFHIQSIIHSSKFETTRIFLERITDADLQLQVHPLIKVLSVQHIFSPSPFGMVINPSGALYIRYRENKYMRSEKTEASYERIFALFIRELNFNIEEKMQDINHYWHDFSTTDIRNFNSLLKRQFEIEEELNVSSFTVLKFPENESQLYYILFNANYIETLHGELDDPVKQSYALRTHSNISKLTDTYYASKRLTDLQNNLLKEMQLGMLHEQKSFISTKVIRQIDEVLAMGGHKKQVSAKLKNINEECGGAILRFDDFIKVMVEQSNDRVYNAVGKKEIDALFRRLESRNKSKQFKVICDSTFVDNSDSVFSYLYTIQFILDELVANAVKQYTSPEGQTIEKQEIKVIVKPTKSKTALIGFGFEVSNSGTKIPDSLIEFAGKERISNGANNSTGFGFYFIQNMLKRILPSPYADGKYFTIRNTPEGVEVKFYVLYKPVRR